MHSRICWIFALNNYADKHDIVYNSHTSVCMYIKSPKLKLHNFPSLYLGHDTLQYVKQYRYLGCIITDTLTDNNDIHKTIRGIYTCMLDPIC